MNTKDLFWEKLTLLKFQGKRIDIDDKFDYELIKLFSNEENSKYINFRRKRSYRIKLK